LRKINPPRIQRIARIERPPPKHFDRGKVKKDAATHYVSVESW
jgi:hypothetical protein